MTEKTRKHVFVGIILVFVGVLVIIVGQRPGMNATAVLVGSIIGVIASIPASIIFTLVARQLQARDKRLRRKRDQPPVEILREARGLWGQGLES